MLSCRCKFGQFFEQRLLSVSGRMDLLGHKCAEHFQTTSMMLSHAGHVSMLQSESHRPRSILNNGRPNSSTYIPLLLIKAVRNRKKQSAHIVIFVCICVIQTKRARKRRLACIRAVVYIHTIEIDRIRVTRPSSVSNVRSLICLSISLKTNWARGYQIQTKKKLWIVAPSVIWEE